MGSVQQTTVHNTTSLALEASQASLYMLGQLRIGDFFLTYRSLWAIDPIDRVVCLYDAFFTPALTSRPIRDYHGPPSQHHENHPSRVFSQSAGA
ncbi:uncharacterized protein LAJ45_10616 [Morchella importuna]|uniref:uncharacterized protein n=1 Tax=Morchella importuna TaxID=1174673 RepID=UPI001E8EF352|nr:uncharacterized protein LAJ45_10616 [Morchella importuna]KAH8145335.1 hypothetical protein LAJ45_10616 [Morchella importuna]